MARSLVLRFVSYIALVSMAVLARPSVGLAQSPPPVSYFNTAITEVYGSPYPLTGKLDIQIFPGGHLRGFYHTSFYKLFIPVVGGQDGNYIWLEIGPSSVDLGLGAGPEGKLMVVATMNGDGSFRGQIYPETAAVLSGISTQLATPSPNSTGSSTDQYLFSATPTAEAEATPAP
ncbi:MAG: hypothetical protein WA814_01515 [Candidatus Baltobacteraceae bacterium]